MDKELFDVLQVRFIKLCFSIRFIEDAILPVDKVSAIRGGIGEMLLQMNCVRDRKCEVCDFETECVVQRILYSKFEKRPDFVTTDGGIGYVLECENYQRSFKEGEKLDFCLILFGKTIVYYYQLFQAIVMLGEQNGIGKYHARFRIDDIKNTERTHVFRENSIDSDKIVVHTLYDYVLFRRMQYNFSKKMYKIIFDTPLSLKYQNEFLQEYRIEAIFMAIKRRIYILNCFEGNELLCQGELDIGIIPKILYQKHLVVGVQRYSTRKKEKMVLHGLKGYMVLSDLSDSMLTLLLVGELIHIGKNTSFGFGKFHIS